jgi:hypothetical protein
MLCIDVMSKEYNKEHKKDTEVGLLKETVEIHEKSLLARRDADFNFNLICEWISKHELNNLSIEELELAQKESKLLMGRLRISVGELKKMDMEYDALRVRVNKYYGKEVLAPLEPTQSWEDMLREMDMDGDGEQWKMG